MISAREFPVEPVAEVIVDSIKDAEGDAIGGGDGEEERGIFWDGKGDAIEEVEDGEMFSEGRERRQKVTEPGSRTGRYFGARRWQRKHQQRGNGAVRGRSG